VLSTLDDETVAVKAVHEGAQDYLVKSELDRAMLVRSIRYGLERKRSEMALLQAEEKYRSIFEHITEGIFQTTPDGRYISANPALASIYGYESPDELIAGLIDIGDQLYVDPGRRPEFIRLMEQHDVVSGFESKVRRKTRHHLDFRKCSRRSRFEASTPLLRRDRRRYYGTEAREEELRNSRPSTTLWSRRCRKYFSQRLE
jgi:PAS domain S-box-containing protein